MKKVIHRKMYDTDTATKVFSVSGADLELTLYKKKTSEFFMYLFNPLVGGLIIPYTEEDAKNWLEKAADGDTYVDIFGEVEE